VSPPHGHEAAIVAEFASLTEEEQELLGSFCKKLGLKGDQE
jgi:hypothetical protein